MQLIAWVLVGLTLGNLAHQALPARENGLWLDMYLGAVGAVACGVAALLAGVAPSVGSELGFGAFGAAVAVASDRLINHLMAQGAASKRRARILRRLLP